MAVAVEEYVESEWRPPDAEQGLANGRRSGWVCRGRRAAVNRDAVSPSPQSVSKPAALPRSSVCC